MIKISEGDDFLKVFLLLKGFSLEGCWMAQGGGGSKAAIIVAHYQDKWLVS